jgi:hypothetical protein
MIYRIRPQFAKCLYISCSSCKSCQSPLYYPLQEGFTYPPVEEEQAQYVPQQEDKGKVVIVYGPSFCPFSYVFLKRAEGMIREIAPKIPIRWIDRSAEPEEVGKRGSVEGCVVNARQVKSFVLDQEGFRKEVTEALYSRTTPLER